MRLYRQLRLRRIDKKKNKLGLLHIPYRSYGFMGRAIIAVTQFGRGSIRLLIILSPCTDDADKRKIIIWAQRTFSRNSLFYFAIIKGRIDFSLQMCTQTKLIILKVNLFKVCALILNKNITSTSLFYPLVSSNSRFLRWSERNLIKKNVVQNTFDCHQRKKANK